MTAVMTVGMLCAASPSEGSTPTSVQNPQAVESTCGTASPSVTTSGSTTRVTPQATAAQCRKAAQHNQQYCRRMKGKAMVACYVAVNAMLAACLATAKGTDAHRR